MSSNRIVRAVSAVAVWLFWMLFPLVLRAQGPGGMPPPTNVSGTILDPTGVPYNTGYIRFDLVPSGGPVPCVGTPCTSINGHYGNVYLDGNGAFQMNLYPNSLISPGGTQWQITVSEPGNPAPWCFGPQSFTAAFTIPNQASYDLSAQLSALAPQLCRNGGGGTIQIEHNGVLVGTQPILNIIDTGTVVATVTNNAGQTRIDISNAASGGGTGCTLPGGGVLYGIVGENPKGTCDDSAQFTWNKSAANLQAASSGSPNTSGTSGTYILGSGNDFGSNTSGAIIGDQSTASSGTHQQQIYMLGSTQTVQQLELNNLVTVNIGSNDIGSSGTANSGGKNNVILGINSTIYQTEQSVNLGSNGFGTTSGTGKQTNGAAIGGNSIGNCVNSSICGASGTGAADTFLLAGDSNQIKGNGTSSNVFLYGYNNRGNTAAANISGGGAYEYGLDNEVNGAVGCDVVIVGSSNTSTTCGTAGFLGASDNFIGGYLNTVTSASQFLALGGGLTLSGCSNCGAIGYRVTNSTNSSLAIGMSNTPELVVTPGNVTYATVAFASLGTPANGTLKYCSDCTIANPCAGGGTGAFAKRLNGVWVCN